MRIKTLFMIGLLPFLTIQAQIGVNTETPLVLFHIDGKGDNNTVPTNAQSINDFTVTADGHVGIGTIKPTVSLDINTGGTPASPKAGFRLVDGSQGVGKFLVSDVSGTATWKSALQSTLVWNSNHRFVIPHTGIYAITLYLGNTSLANPYTNRWINPTLSGRGYDAVALYSYTRGNFLISNAGVANRGVYCSGTLVLNAGEIVGPEQVYWGGTATPVLSVEIISR